MQYVADRLFSKVSGMDAGDAALGAAGLGLGAAAAGAPAIQAAAARALSDRGAIGLGTRMAVDKVTPGIQRPVTPELQRALGRAQAVDAARVGAAKRVAGLNIPGKARVGAGALAALLGAGGLYGALKD